MPVENFDAGIFRLAWVIEQSYHNLLIRFGSSVENFTEIHSFFWSGHEAKVGRKHERIQCLAVRKRVVAIYSPRQLPTFTENGDQDRVCSRALPSFEPLRSQCFPSAPGAVA